MKVYTKECTKEISFPLGGIGTGSLGLAGNGNLVDWEIFNRPAKGRYNGYSHFAVRAIDADGKIVAKALCGDTQRDFSGQRGAHGELGATDSFGFGVFSGTMAGFPHFPDWVLESHFPFATLRFRAPDFPAEVTLTAFNPFIPMDEDASGLPAAFFEVSFRNTSTAELRFSAALSVARPFSGNNHAQDLCGTPVAFLQSDRDTEDVDYRDMTLAVDAPGTSVQSHWLRGAWQDAVTRFWREFSECEQLRMRSYEENAESDTATVIAELTIPAGEERRARFLLAWNAPNCYNYWSAEKEGLSRAPWKHHYATRFADSRACASYCLANWATLAARSRAFANAVFSTTVEDVMLEAATANLCVLKSPTVLRLTDGTLWGWEGVASDRGSCRGTCSHVWAYAYALPLLFPRLARGIREVDYRYNQNENGAISFRLNLPLGSPMAKKLACVDGQMSGILQTYREWKYAGDTDWLRTIWPKVKKALEYAWCTDDDYRWDADRDGVLEGRQHHTLDMELFGPSSWLQGFYIAALDAAAEMAETVGESESAALYRTLSQKGREWCEKNLFNGEYYAQKIDLKDRSLVERYNAPHYWDSESGTIKYQIADGCEIDQVLPQWHATLCGLADVYDREHLVTALHSLYRNNYKPRMRDVANCWRVFALDDEAGTIMCDYPDGVEKPPIPIPYCEECMTGFEYALAGLMLANGMRNEALDLVRAVRDRYDGAKRNPFNEIECGSNYARTLAAWALIPLYCGFTFDLTKGRIGFAPRSDASHFCSFFACGEAWGTVAFAPEQVTLTLTEGTLTLETLALPCAAKVKQVSLGGTDVAFSVRGGAVQFTAPLTLTGTLTLVL